MAIDTFAPINTGVVQNNRSVTKPNKSEPAKPQQSGGLSNKAMLGIGAGIVAAATIGILIAKGNFSQAKQVAEHIDFKKAETIEDAIKFGSEHLGIKKYSGFETADLDVLNWVNEGLTNVSNAMKGKAKLPKNVLYMERKGTSLASVTPDKKSLIINKKVYGDLDNAIKNRLESLKDVFYIDKDGLFRVPLEMGGSDMQAISPLIGDYYKFTKGELKTFDEKLQFFHNMDAIYDSESIFYAAPDITLKRLLSTPGVKEILDKTGIQTEASVLSKLSLEDKQDLISDILEACGKNGQFVGINFKPVSKFDTIYHEMGHLADNNVNEHAFAAYHNYNTPEKIKALDDWVTNPEIMQAAGSVSDYAQSDAAEFIAETFARLCDNKEITDEAMALYKKLGGPLPV